MASLASDGEGQKRAAALAQGLAALNWRDGGNLSIDWRWAGGDPALFQRYAAEMVQLGPEALVAEASPSVEALRRQTGTIPIVFLIVTDPVGQGFVQSLARPGGNITGFSNYDPPMAGKWLGMLTQITPPVARVAVLYNPGHRPGVRGHGGDCAGSRRCRDRGDHRQAHARRARGVNGLAGHLHSSASRRYCRPRRPIPPPRCLSLRLLCLVRRANGLRHRHRKLVPALGGLCRSPPEWRQSKRSSGPATDEIYAGDQPEDRRGARRHRAAGATGERR